MKYWATKTLAILALFLVVAAGCKDRNAEKRIAALENELKELKGTKTADHDHAAEEKAAAENVKPDGPLPTISFATTDHDFGTVREGQVVEHSFTFTNNGEAPLIIQNAQPSCGCTVPDWTKTPIPPGGTGFVKAKFDSNGRPNLQNKTITVFANTWPQQTVLRFKVMVTPKAKQPDAGPLKQ